MIPKKSVVVATAKGIDNNLLDGLARLDFYPSSFCAPTNKQLFLFLILEDKSISYFML